MIQRVGAANHGKASARTLHDRAEPENGAVLLPDGTARGGLDNVEDLHGSPHRVPITSVLSDSCAIFSKSAGEPRRTPGIAWSAPRSSTHMPQLTQSSLVAAFSAVAIIAAIRSFVSIWFSS